MPRLWHDSVEAHRDAVRDAVLDATAVLVAEQGLPAVTMSRIAQHTGIGRATLYKYFADVDAVLTAWHDRQITGHLAHLAQVRDRSSTAAQRLEAALAAYAMTIYESRGHHDSELAALLHRGEQVMRAQQHLRDFLRDLLAEGQVSGDFRDDTAPDELAAYCLHALTAAASLRSDSEVRRLVNVTLTGLGRPPR